MMLISNNSDLSSSILSPPPMIPYSDESSSPIASIRAHVVQSLTLSSPNRDSPKETLINGEGNDSQAMQIEREIQIKSKTRTLDVDDYFWDACISLNPSHRWTPNVSPVYDTDDDDSSSSESTQSLLRLKQHPLQIVEPIGVGLWNLGNTCFINSVLQCFTHTVPLIKSICSYDYQDPCNYKTLTMIFRGHIEAALTTCRRPLHLFRFVDNIKSTEFSPEFRRYQQEDAHEFLQAFLDRLERCCVGRRFVISEQDDNIVDQVFGGRLVSGLRCCKCNSVSKTFENSVGLSLEIEDMDNLQNALDSFTRVEKLEEQLTCDKCKEKVSKEKHLLLEKLPQVASFHLKRFKNNGYLMEKISKCVRFPLELDLQPYMSSSQNNQVATKYYLYAIVEHLGSSLASGHYCSYVRSAPKLWHEFDDQKVTRIDEDSVLSRDAYILFYAREGVSWFIEDYQEMQPLVDSSLQNSSPTFVLDSTNGECLSDISYEGVNKSIRSCNPTEVSDLHAKTIENLIFLSNESNEDVFQSATESSGQDSPMAEILDPRDPDDASYPPCAEKEPNSLAMEIATTGDEFVSLLTVQNQVSSPKPQEGTFQIQLECLETGKNQEKEPSEQSRDDKDTQTADRDLENKPSPYTQALKQTIPETGSPPKRLKREWRKS